MTATLNPRSYPDAPTERAPAGHALPIPVDGRARVIIDNVSPAVPGVGTAMAVGDLHVVNRIKRVRGDVVFVSADLLVDGHDKIAGALLFRRGRNGGFSETPLADLGAGTDRFGARFRVDEVGIWQYTIEAWVDTYATWLWGLGRKANAGQDVSLELREGAALITAAAARASGIDATALKEAAAHLVADGAQAERVAAAQASALIDLMRHHGDRSAARRLPAPLEITVDPERARFSSWYEMFPRSMGKPGHHGTLHDAETHLSAIAQMGFDVVYLPPIHPIGRSHRKGPNNTLTAGPNDPGSPWAIGAAEGGHKSVHPQLGTIEDLQHFVKAARALDIEVALDIAFQASPDHPYVREHPEWFVTRADGSIQYAENPPKKYQDVYPFDFSGTGWQSLWQELCDVFLFWIEQGVRVFRVDNPHTKPLPFWRWCIEQIKERHPDVIFLSEAFTRPKLMYNLAKAGFSQSYTYFTWRTSKRELTEYLTEITRGPVAEFFRPNLWPNTPDILPEHLQVGTRGTFTSRLILAGTLSSSYGIYGPPYELMERTPREGAEEYVDNEKFQIRHWQLDRPDSLRPVIRRLNQIRKANPALHDNASLTFHPIDNDLLIAYSKRSADGENLIVTVVNLDGRHRQAGWLELDANALGLTADETVQAHDLLTDARYLWGGRRVYVELDPDVMPAHIFRLRRKSRSERNFEYYL
ncbi:MAG TPA: alpha-1,4-glucan--maltose-1-phosphate maltosyltransferase [Polyangia bacterium]